MLIYSFITYLLALYYVQTINLLLLLWSFKEQYLERNISSIASVQSILSSCTVSLISHREVQATAAVMSIFLAFSCIYCHLFDQIIFSAV